MIDPREQGKGWIGVDLDGTLAKVDYKIKRPDDFIGEPIAPMIKLVRGMLADDEEVRIFTARPKTSYPAIKRFCRDNLGQVLRITDKKDAEMIAMYDDRAIQVERNTGKVISDATLS